MQVNKTKVAIIQTHPIQHFCPQFASYAKISDIDLSVIFETNKGLEAYFDKDFNKEVKWQDIDLSVFKHTFLNADNTLEEVLSNFNPEVVIVYGYSKQVHKKATSWAFSNNKFTFYISDTENHQKRNRFKQFVKRIYLNNFFKKIDIVMSVGDANEDFYKWCGVSKEKIVRMFFPINCLELDQVYASKNENIKKIRSKHSIADDTIILSTVGKLVSWKSQSDIIDLLSVLEKRHIKCTAVLLGSGEDEQILTEKGNHLSTNSVIFTGFVQPSDMMQYLSATDIYIHPAEREPHSLAISEAIYLGCPVLISDRCGSYGPTDDVQPGKNGFVYSAHDIHSLANYVEQLNKHRNLMLQFSESSLKISRQNQKLAHSEALKAAINLVKYK